MKKTTHDDHLKHSCTIINNFYDIFCIKKQPTKCKHVFWNYKVGGPMPKEAHMLDLSCTNEEKVHVALNPVTKAGHPIPVENFAVSVQSGDGTFATDPDGALGFYAISGDNPGDTVYMVTADADLGEGVENISDIVNLHVAGAKAAALGLTAGTPELK